jgi:hypothetical protein
MYVCAYQRGGLPRPTTPSSIAAQRRARGSTGAAHQQRRQQQPQQQQQQAIADATVTDPQQLRTRTHLVTMDPTAVSLAGSLPVHRHHPARGSSSSSSSNGALFAHSATADQPISRAAARRQLVTTPEGWQGPAAHEVQTSVLGPFGVLPVGGRPSNGRPSISPPAGGGGGASSTKVADVRLSPTKLAVQVVVPSVGA